MLPWVCNSFSFVQHFVYSAGWLFLLTSSFLHDSDSYCLGLWWRTPDLPSHSIGRLPSIYSHSVGLAATTIRLARTSLPGKQTNKNKRQWEGARVRGRCSTMMHTKRQGMQTNAQRRRDNVPRLLPAQTHRCRQTHRHTNTQRDGSAVTGHGWLPRGPQALLLRSRRVALNLG